MGYGEMAEQLRSRHTRVRVGAETDVILFSILFFVNFEYSPGSREERVKRIGVRGLGGI